MLLLSPGPGICDRDVLNEIAKPCIHHRSTPFKNIYQDIVKDIKKLVNAPNGEVIIMNGSGSYGMEGATLNLLKKDDKVLSIRCGYFGDRLFSMARNRGCDMFSLSYQKYNSYDIHDVSWMLNHHDIKALLVTHCESETGTLQDLWKLGELCHKHNVLFIVDSISGAIMNEVDMENMHIDCLIMASQKGFLMPPGLSISVLSQKAVQVMKEIPNKSYVFDYGTILKKFYNDARIHSTPSIPLYCGLHLALKKLNSVPLIELTTYYHDLHEYVRNKLKKLHFTIMAKGHESNSIIVCKVPHGYSACAIQKALEEKDVRIEVGLLDNEDKILRIGIMNAISIDDCDILLQNMREILYET